MNENDVKNLKPAIEAKVLNEVDRLSLVDDMFALVQAGKADTVDVLELMKSKFYALCSRNFQNVKLRLDFVNI